MTSRATIVLQSVIIDDLDVESVATLEPETDAICHRIAFDLTFGIIHAHDAVPLHNYRETSAVSASHGALKRPSSLTMSPAPSRIATSSYTRL